MSLENEDRGLSDKDSGMFDVDLEKPKISYSREFLLTLSKLDICKKLPIGFDESLLSELEYAPQGVSDRQKIPGSTPLHGFKRNEYGSSPPTRKDFGSYPRNTYGKWESRSSGRSDRDSDSQSDKDSDSGKRYGPQPRRSWQSPPEHDGLLGSGSFPRPSGYAGGVSAPKVQTNGPHQLSKSTEPYQPPKPYKALPHPRRDTDAFNDETFGSAELTSEERAEEERKRRDSFEMMRKEQQKALQEKQKLGLDKAGCSGTPDLFEMLGKNNEKKGPVKNNDVGVPATTTISSNDIERASFGSNSPAIRPLIPPGFRNNVLDKTSGLTSLIPPHLSEVEKIEIGENLKDTESRLLQNNNHEGLEWQLSQNMSLVDGQLSEKTHHTPLLSEGQNFSLQKDFNVPIRKLSMVDQNIVGVNASAIGDNSVADSNKSSSTSIFEKIFGNTSSASGSGFSSAELQGSKPDDIQSSKPVKSSKFALWFSEEESKAPNDTSFERPNDLLSLLATGNKSRNQVSDTETGDNLAQNHSYQNSNLANKITPGLHSACSIVSNQVSVETKEKAVPSLPALTCEDLEQSILSEYSVKRTDTQPLLKSRSDISAKLEEPSAKVNNNASVHLLSLLQKGKEHTNANPIFNLADKRQASLENDLVKVVNDPIREENIKNTPNLGDSVLGTDFMDAIKSAKAPVSITSGINQIGLQNPSKEYSGMISDNRQQIKLSNSENWLGFDDPHNVITSQMHHIGAVPKISGFEAVPHARLPEENLISVSDPRYHGMSMNMPTGNSSKNSKIALNAPLSINDKLAALSAAVNDERVMARSESLSFPRGPYDQMEPIQQSSQFQPPQLNQARPLYNQMQAHPRMKFLGTDPMLNYGSANRRFPSNDVGPFHHSNVPAYHSMMPQMQMPGNHSPHLVPEFTSGPSSRHGNQPTALTHDINQMHGFPLGTRQPGPNHGVPMPGPNTNSGGPTPEAFQRLMEMELHANSKQNHPFTHGRDAGMHGLR